MKASIAVIPPVGPADVLADTVLDGLILLAKENPSISFVLPREYSYESPLSLDEFKVPEKEFIEYAQKADLVFYLYGKRETNTKLAEKINLWQKTFYIDGSEVGGNRRYDETIQKKILEGSYTAHGKIDKRMLSLCAHYFRREKPYIEGITPLPFGIESRYIEFYSPEVKKDIDIFCVFGQDEYPLMRRYAKELVKNFCLKNNLTFQTETTKGFSFDPFKKNGREEFYKKLARAKVGISIGGGGFDTARFWEILGNNCLLLTEKIDIYPPDSTRLHYERIKEFNNLYDLQTRLNELLPFMTTTYNEAKLEPEYTNIMQAHSSKARVLEILAVGKEKGLLKE